MKRTIKPAAGDSRVSAATAESVARYVYRDPRTGKLVMSKYELVMSKYDRAPRRGEILPKSRRITTSTVKQDAVGASKKR